jgi:hypothetical protein
MTMRFLWTAIALCTAVVISSSNAEARRHKQQQKIVKFDNCLVYTWRPSFCPIVDGYWITNLPWPPPLPYSRVSGEGRVTKGVNLCGLPALEVRSFKVGLPGPCNFVGSR